MAEKDTVKALQKFRDSTYFRVVVIEASIERAKESGIPHIMQETWFTDRAGYEADIARLDELIRDLHEQFV